MDSLGTLLSSSPFLSFGKLGGKLWETLEVSTDALEPPVPGLQFIGQGAPSFLPSETIRAQKPGGVSWVSGCCKGFGVAVGVGWVEMGWVEKKPMDFRSTW